MTDLQACGLLCCLFRVADMCSMVTRWPVYYCESPSSPRGEFPRLTTSSGKTGGQDDLVNIFSPWEQRVIARCQGHSSFLSGLAFDDLRCDGRTYRFGSVGEDNKLILVKYFFFGVAVELALM